MGQGGPRCLEIFLRVQWCRLSLAFMGARPLIPILPANGYAELLELTGLGGSRLAKLFRRDELEHATTFIVTLACEPIDGIPFLKP
jgi:hypothetical protein